MPKENKIIKPKTIKELLKAWDDGKYIFSIRCCNGAPSQEQSAQVAMIEFIRDNHTIPCNPKQWDALCEKTLTTLKEKLVDLDESHINWAKWWSHQLCLPDGIEKAFAKIVEAKGSILIPITKRFPVVFKIQKN